MRKLGMILMPILILALIIVTFGCGGEAAVPAPLTSARASALETDLVTVKAAVDAYVIQSGRAPTSDGQLPVAGEYTPIDFFASFQQYGNTLSFYPDFIMELPRHYDEGVWRIDSEIRVSVAVAPVNY
jgi:hypothetical protein